jgi:hypothetical protein
MNGEKLIEGIYSMTANGNYKMAHLWITEIVFTWKWWFGVALTIVPWILWVIFRDKKDTVRILFVGLVVMIVTVIMDNIGISYNLWHYDSNVLPFSTIFFPWDCSLLPVDVMFTLQYFPKLNPFIKALVLAILCAFITEPFFAWIKMYSIVHWKFWYSFVIYIPLYLLFNWIYEGKLFHRNYT